LLVVVVVAAIISVIMHHHTCILGEPTIEYSSDICSEETEVAKDCPIHSASVAGGHMIDVHII
jgi:hypothetical protein